MSQEVAEKPKLHYPEIVGPEFENRWVENMTDAEYHADKTAAGSSSVRSALVSALNYFWEIVEGNGKKETQPMRFGSAVHMAVLEPDLFLKRYVELEDFGDMRSSTNRAKRDAWVAAQPRGAVILTKEELRDLLIMIERIKANPYAVGMLTGALREITGYFRDPETGLKCKIRIDILPEDLGWLPDLKTTRLMTLTEMGREIRKKRYYVQLAFYAFGVYCITGKWPAIKGIIFVQNQGPHDVVVMPIGDESMRMAMIEMREGINRIAEGVKSGRWLGLQPDGPTTYHLPHWHAVGESE